MNGECPSEFHRELGESAEHGFLYALFLFVVVVLHIFPLLGFERIGMTVFGLDNDIFVAEGGNFAESSINPALHSVVANENHLCTHFEGQFLRCREVLERESTLDNAAESAIFGGKFGEVAFIDGIYGVAS